LTKTTKLITLLILSIPGFIISYLLAFLIESILIPDECYYETHNSNWMIELFYDFPGWNGFHPYPSNFQFALMSILGIYLSFLFCKRVLKI
jgi:hypothetical protein